MYLESHKPIIQAYFSLSPFDSSSSCWRFVQGFRPTSSGTNTNDTAGNKIRGNFPHFLRLTPLNVKEGLRPLHRLLIAAGFHFCKASRREHTGVGKGLPKVVVSHLVVLIVVSFTLPAFPKAFLVPCSSKSAVGPSNPIEDFFVEDPAGSLESTVPHPVPQNARRALGLGLSLVAYPQPSLIGKSSP